LEESWSDFFPKPINPRIPFFSPSLRRGALLLSEEGADLLTQELARVGLELAELVREAAFDRRGCLS
jgi:hypothetical protein